MVVESGSGSRTVGTDPSKLHTVCVLNDFEFLRGQGPVAGAGGTPFGIVG